MPNYSNNNKKDQINFAAGHDQASISEKMSKEYEMLSEIPNKLEEIVKSIQSYPEVKTYAELQKLSKEIDEQQIAAINLVKYGKQITVDLCESIKKLNAIYQTPPDEKLKKAKSLCVDGESVKPQFASEPLNKSEEYRFEEIEEALSNTYIILSAGDEVIKYQLGILGNARENNIISEFEFKHLVSIRINPNQNNLLDAYKYFKKNDMRPKRTPLEICQTINQELSSDPDYVKSKDFFVERFKGMADELEQEIDYRVKERKNKDSTELWKELEALGKAAQNSKDSLEGEEEGEVLSLPEVETTLLEDTSSQQTPNVAMKGPELKKSDFVEFMQELIPETEKNKIRIDEISPTPVEKIMRITLQQKTPISDNEINKLSYSGISKAKDIVLETFNSMLNDIRNPSYISNNGSITFKKMMKDINRIEEEYDKKVTETKPCELTGEDLVNEYFKFGKRHLENKQKRIEKQIRDLKSDRKEHYGMFSDHALNSEEGGYKKNREEIYQKERTKLNDQLQKTNQQKALWEGSRTLRQAINKNNQEGISSLEKELDSFESQRKSIEKQICGLNKDKKKHCGKFSRYVLESEHAPLTRNQKKQIREEIYKKESTELNKKLQENALLKENETLRQAINKNNQEEISFPQKELNSRDLVLEYNPNYKSQKKIHVHRDGVHLVSKEISKKTELEVPLASDIKPIASGSEFSPNRMTDKKLLSGISSLSFYAIHSDTPVFSTVASVSGTRCAMKN